MGLPGKNEKSVFIRPTTCCEIKIIMINTREKTDGVDNILQPIYRKVSMVCGIENKSDIYKALYKTKIEDVKPISLKLPCSNWWNQTFTIRIQNIFKGIKWSNKKWQVQTWDRKKY